MAGISSKAAGGIENKKKYQGYEYNSDFDLDFDESFYRTYDPQIGRFLQSDPSPKFEESPYVAMGNNPVSNVDPLGDTWTGTDWPGFTDMLAGIIYGAVDNIMGTSLRETYNPINPETYNNSLRGTDVAMVAAGGVLIADGLNKAKDGLVISTADVSPEIGIPVAFGGLLEAAIGYLMASNAVTNIAKGYNYGTKPNDGVGPTHGSPEHNDKVDKKIEEAKKDPDNSNFRKNQTQHDKDGNKVGNNRPDAQWDNKKTGHQTHEVDTKQKSSDNHKKTIRKNDPKVNDTYEVLPTPKFKPLPKG